MPRAAIKPAYSRNEKLPRGRAAKAFYKKAKGGVFDGAAGGQSLPLDWADGKTDGCAVFMGKHPALCADFKHV